MSKKSDTEFEQLFGDKFNEKLAQLNSTTTQLIQKPFSEITPQLIQWIWKGRIARGKICVFAGEPGLGKSQLLLWLASMVSNGGSMPVDGNKFPEGKVAILSAEDDDEDTMWPRLKALNANMDNVLQLFSSSKIGTDGVLQDDTVRLDQDIQKLDNTLANNKGYTLLIIDPITAYLGDINDHKNSEVRALYAKMTRLAKKHNIGIVFNTHLSKPANNSTGSAMNRVIGSIAFIAAARSAYLICPQDESDRSIKQFIPMKNNIGDDKTGFEYRIISTTVNDIYETSRIEWLKDSITRTANDALNKCTTPKLTEAEDFLMDKLKNGTMPVRDVRREATDLGISTNRLYAAKDKLGVIEDHTLDKPRLTTWTLKSIS